MRELTISQKKISEVFDNRTMTDFYKRGQVIHSDKKDGKLGYAYTFGRRRQRQKECYY